MGPGLDLLEQLVTGAFRLAGSVLAVADHLVLVLDLFLGDSTIDQLLERVQGCRVWQTI
jgi:hypothetical protein